MICAECKRAGTANTLGNEEAARALHARCLGGCFCQHRTGGYIDVTKITSDATSNTSYDDEEEDSS